MANALAGSALFSVDGVTFQVAGALSYSPVTVSRETLTGQSGVAGFKEMPAPGKISGTIRDAGDLTVQDFNDMDDVTIVLLLVNGKTVTGSGMWSTEPAVVNTEDGTFEIVFEGIDGSVVEDF